MKTGKYIKGLFLVWMTAVLSACTAEDNLLSEEGRETTVTYRPALSGTLDTRAIGDAEGIDRLKVAVYEGSTTLVHKFTSEKEWDDVERNGIALNLIEGKTYQILFWAEDKDNSAYTLTKNGKISVNYKDYLNGGFAKMEEMDAFYGISSVTVGKNENRNIILTRPFAQLNFADNITKPEQGTHKAVVTFHSIPTEFDPFGGTIIMTDAGADEDDVTFTFTDFPENETLSNGYFYISCNYLFAPKEGTRNISVTLDLQKTDGTTVNKFEFKGEKAIVIEKNKKTNVYGAIVQQPETWSVWDGTIPAESTLTTDAENRYIIDEAADIAWLSQNGTGLDDNCIFLQTKNIDMNNHEVSIKLPQSSTFDGGGKTIKNYAASLFGDATKLTVKDLIVENITAEGTTHAGTLVNTLKGSSSFTNVTVTNSSATTENGAAGGMVGYVVRTSEKERSETLEVSFRNCKLNGVTVSASASEGKFVGLLSGYDNKEKLSFDSNCEANVTIADYTSVYTQANQSAWVSSDVTNKYDGWLGHETYRRGNIEFNGVRMAPRWDGTTKITPLKEGTTQLIYSAFDLANCAGTNPGSIKFMEDVDMGAKVFNPLTNISKLSGEGKTIYNMKVETTFNTNSWDGGGFVRRCSAATIENITFKNADVKVTHIEGSDGDAYASIVCGTAEGNNTMTNVKVVGGKLYGCNKMGGIAGYITGTFNATNCSVDGLSIENYDSGGKDSFGFKANGEVGGAFGFVAANSTISGCYVKNTTLNCIGVNNGRALFIFKYAGRHVNEFIGDIRTTSGQEITITYEEKEFTGNVYKNRKDQYSGCKYIGHCYYTNILTIKDTKGTVNVNGKSITVVENY